MYDMLGHTECRPSTEVAAWLGHVIFITSNVYGTHALNKIFVRAYPVNTLHAGQ